MRESKESTDLRRAKLQLLQEHYRHFATFLKDGMAVLGFKPTWMQYDIANYLQFGPDNLMVQAQRGEAKSTITAMFAVWKLLHDPQHRVLIVSAASKQANEISTLIQRLIMTWDVLDCLRPDKNEGDRTSVEAFDVHYALKGVDKSPSVACVGITASLQGKRADLLIADDVESTKNSLSAQNREMVLMQTLEFSAICTGRPGVPARIVYLGTPQTSESIYNSLPGRGFDVRIWPGRYPTPAQRESYGTHLAPSIVSRLEANPELAFGGGAAGNDGQPTDPQLFDEEKLQAKFLDRGPASFQLNYMLNTTLTDSQRFPLKLENCVVLPGSSTGRFPLVITRGLTPQHRKTVQSSGKGFQMSVPGEVGNEMAELQAINFYIDPAGGGVNGDETAFAVTGFLNSTVYVLAIGGYAGGYGQDSLDALASIAEKFKPNSVTIEKNMGNGAFAQTFLPTLRKKYDGLIEEPYVTGQKETRIIGILEPVIARGSLVFLESAIEMDDQTTERYNNSGKRAIYSVFHQMSKLTTQRKCLLHDDRIDALAGSVGTWVKQLALDQEKVIQRQKDAAFQEWLNDPTGMKRATMSRPMTRSTSLLDRFTRR